MDQNLFSNNLPVFEGEMYNANLVESISLLKQFLRKRKLSLLTWDENRIAVPLKLLIDIPPLGTFDNIDIRREEDVLFVFEINRYPTVAPSVHTNRLDFPKNQLAHLYVAKEGRPPAFCYVRGSYNEWYTNKRVTDLVIRIQNWLRDAAAGELTENGNQFDPLRLEGYRGTVIYSYDKIVQTISSNQSFLPDSNFALALFENTAKDEEFPSFKLEKIITPDEFEETLKKYIASLREFLEKKTFKIKKYHLGYILWSRENTTHKDYCVALPKTWESFKKFCSDFSVDLSQLEEFIAQFNYNVFTEVPIVTALKRPMQLIGFSSTIEFINFYLELKDEHKHDKLLDNNIPVHFQAHNEPLTTAKAQLISGSGINFNGAAIVGCGALGSKIALHFIRNGVKNLLLLDNDKLAPHNLVRHALTPASEGANKAVALMLLAANMYRTENITDIVMGFPVSGNYLLEGKLDELKNNLKWLFDFTASESFFQTLISPDTRIDAIRICRGSISDHGQMGILFFEGENRNPRIDDLQAVLFSSYKKNDIIRDWLKREKEQANEQVHLQVGVGCNSETIILADDVVSLHAAYFSMVIKSEARTSKASGKIFLNILSNNSVSVTTHEISVMPFLTTKAVNDSSWEIRIKAGIVETMKAEMGLAMPHETGGVFVGTVSYKTKTIHVVDIIEAPPDSMSNASCFFRGIDGLRERVKGVNEASGNQLGYIGEWHSHPFGPNAMSSIDAATVRKFETEFSGLPTPLPVFLTIVTPSHLLCYVY